MVLDIGTILLGAGVAVIAVLLAAPRGYLGHPRKKSSAEVASLETYTTATEQVTSQVAEVPAAAEPAPSIAPPPLYESVQPAPAPVMTYSAPSSTSFGAPSMTKKPTRTYRRRSIPAKSSVVPKATRNAKSRKR